MSGVNFKPFCTKKRYNVYIELAISEFYLLGLFYFIDKLFPSSAKSVKQFILSCKDAICMNKYCLAQFNSQFVFFGFSPDVVIVIIFLFHVRLINQKKNQL